MSHPTEKGLLALYYSTATLLLSCYPVPWWRVVVPGLWEGSLEIRYEFNKEVQIPETGFSSSIAHDIFLEHVLKDTISGFFSIFLWYWFILVCKRWYNGIISHSSRKWHWISFGIVCWKLYLVINRSHIHKRPLGLTGWLWYSVLEDRLHLV